MKAVRLRIVGLVQGVNYRASFAREAQQRGLAGWVRNRRDGSVEALLGGEAQPLQDMIDWARKGPPAARVARVEQQDCDEEFEAGFRILPDA